MGSWQETPLAKQTPVNASLPFFTSVSSPLWFVSVDRTRLLATVTVLAAEQALGAISTRQTPDHSVRWTKTQQCKGLARCGPGVVPSAVNAASHCWLYSCSDRGVWFGFSDASNTNWEETRRIKLESCWLLISLLQTGSWMLSYYPSTASSILLLMQTVYNTVQSLLFGKGTDLNWAVSWTWEYNSFLPNTFLSPFYLLAPPVQSPPLRPLTLPFCPVISAVIVNVVFIIKVTKSN